MRQSKMPLRYYRPMHPGAAPKAQDVDVFCAWAQSRPPTVRRSRLSAKGIIRFAIYPSSKQVG